MSFESDPKVSPTSSAPISLSSRVKNRRFIVPTSCVVLTVVSDQVTKQIAVAELRKLDRLSYLGDLFRLHYTENRGAFLSFGSELPESYRFWIFSVAVALLLAVITFFLLSTKSRSESTLALALVVGGGIGNLIDRSRFGYVVDFMNIGLGPFRTGVFNIADIAIMIGIFSLFKETFKDRAK